MASAILWPRRPPSITKHAQPQNLLSMVCVCGERRLCGKRRLWLEEAVWHTVLDRLTLKIFTVTISLFFWQLFNSNTADSSAGTAVHTPRGGHLAWTHTHPRQYTCVLLLADRWHPSRPNLWFDPYDVSSVAGPIPAVSHCRLARADVVSMAFDRC